MTRRDDILRALRRALTPPAPALAALVVVSAAGLAWTFLLSGEKGTPVAYLSYVLSAYALVAVCTSVATTRPLARLRAALPSNPFVDRVIEDADFRTKLTFAASSVLRVVWTVFNAVMGVMLQSAWYVTLAVYYLVLSIMRGSLMRHLHSGEGAGLFDSSAYAVRLAEVLVSLFALEVAMLKAFSTPGQEAFDMTMINSTGVAILAILVLTGTGLIRRANRALREPNGR